MNKKNNEWKKISIGKKLSKLLKRIVSQLSENNSFRPEVRKKITLETAVDAT